MSIQPDDLLKVAHDLLQKEGEIYFRSAANRAYYAAFHFCRLVVEALPVPPRKKKLYEKLGPHQKVIFRLKNKAKNPATQNADQKTRSLGHFLNNGRVIRVQADYKIETGFARSKAEEVILSAVKIKAVLGEISRA